MQEAILHINEVGKRKDKQKVKKTFPTIRREDIMTGILSTELSYIERSKLSSLYAEITHMEKQDLKYITEIAVSSKSDSEIYEMLQRLNRKKEKLEKIELRQQTLEKKFVNQFCAENNQSDILKILNLLENYKEMAVHDKETIIEFREKYPNQLNANLIQNFLDIKNIYNKFLNDGCKQTQVQEN